MALLRSSRGCRRAAWARLTRKRASPPGAVGRPGATRVTLPEPAPRSGRHRAARVTVHANIGPRGLFNLLRALMWLRDEHATVEVQLHLTATSSDGFDKVTLCNWLVEPLEEAATDLDVGLD